MGERCEAHDGGAYGFFERKPPICAAAVVVAVNPAIPAAATQLRWRTAARR
jgi:hypothetical protein